MLLAGSVNSDWYLGLTIGFVLVTVVVLVVAVILSYASRIAEQAWVANEGLKDVRERTRPLAAVRQTNASGLAILAAAKRAREVVVAKVTGVAPAPPEPPPVIPGPTRTSPSFEDPSPATLDADGEPGSRRFTREEGAPAPAEEPPSVLQWNPGRGGQP